MDSLKFLVAIYNLGLGCGLFTTQDVIKFCDTIIEHIDKPPYGLIEISMMSHAKNDDVEWKLREFHGNIDLNDIAPIVISLIGSKYLSEELDLRGAIRCTTRLLIGTGLDGDEKYYDLYCIDDSYELAQSGIYGNIDEVSTNFSKCIDGYSQYFNEFERAIEAVNRIG